MMASRRILTALLAIVAFCSCSGQTRRTVIFKAAEVRECRLFSTDLFSEGRLIHVEWAARSGPGCDSWKSHPKWDVKVDLLIGGYQDGRYDFIDAQPAGQR